METNKKNQAFQNAWAKIVAKAWSDESFKQKLLKNPESVLKDNGIESSARITYKVLENTDTVINLVLPTRPKGELHEQDLKKIAAAGDAAWCACSGCAG